MKAMQLILFITGLGAFIIHGFFPSVFQIDWFSVLILFVLSIPFLAIYLRKAKFPGAEFEFKEEIKETKRLVQISVEKAKKTTDDTSRKQRLPFETFKLSSAKELLDSDPTLALASLRIEIERTVRNYAEFKAETKEIESSSLLSLIDLAKELGALSVEQVLALRKIISICNKAVHGLSVSKSQADEIIGLAEQLNHSFSIGNSINMFPNKDHDKHGLLCEWEHCIELMPLTHTTKQSCPTFGHDCPGGSVKVSLCDKKIENIPENRFPKK